MSFIEASSDLGGKELNEEIKNDLSEMIKDVFQKEQSLILTMIEIVRALEQVDVSLPDKFLAGIFKGLAVLEGERYVSSEKFQELITKEISRVLVYKLPLTMREMWQNSLIQSARILIGWS